MKKFYEEDKNQFVLMYNKNKMTFTIETGVEEYTEEKVLRDILFISSATKRGYENFINILKMEDTPKNKGIFDNISDLNNTMEKALLVTSEQITKDLYNRKIKIGKKK